MIGIIVADENEFKNFPYPFVRTEARGQFNFNFFQINEQELIIVHSGIGLINASACAQMLTTIYKVKAICNYGAVGGDKKTNLFEVIAPKTFYYHDVKTPWYPQGQTPGEAPSFTNALIKSEWSNVNLASGGAFLSSEKEIEEIQKNLDVHIFDMETTAIAQIAHKVNVPLYVVKCVSDIVGVDSSALGDINERITKAGTKAMKFLIEEIINNILPNL